MPDAELTPGEFELLIAGLDDDIDLSWVLINLGFGNPPPSVPPPPPALDAVFDALRRLLDTGLIQVGHMARLDGGPPRRVPRLRHVTEHLDEVRRRVDEAVLSATRVDDWAFQCWVVNTPTGDEVARAALERRH